MNLSKLEQRVLHELALGGEIRHLRGGNGKIHTVTCFTREGHVLSCCTLEVFVRLKRRGLVRSRNGQPYRVSRLGVTSVRAQLNQR